MIDADDRKRINELRKKYNNIIYNMWNPFDKQKEELLGCNTVNRLYVTPAGDVFPCPFLHIKIGNIHENTVQEILDYGFSIRYFHDYQDKCLAGEDVAFLSKFSRPGMSIFNPLDAREIFADEDYVTEPKAQRVA
jgi:MoaA/NifB/PqqE/SkfB family radical SAM enzyme